MTAEQPKDEAPHPVEGVDLGADAAWDRIAANVANLTDGAMAVRRYYAERREIVRWVSALSAAAVFATTQLRNAAAPLTVLAEVTFACSVGAGVMFAFVTDLAVSRWANSVGSHARELSAAIRERQARARTVKIPESNWIAKELKQYSSQRDAALDEAIQGAVDEIGAIGEGRWSELWARLCVGGFIVGIISVATAEAVSAASR
ncbi:MAG TPA: hypothetical protein DCK98_12405 [Chloroflexi bacterium]|nr:hypothetical protein [Chloroflexota bacterium]HAL26882.1 hypothetical protein [Chloroflexota bacterium]